MAQQEKYPVMAVSLKEQLENIIQSEDLFNDEDELLVAVSGGIDSMCLLQLLSKVHKGKIEVGHVNYQMRNSDSEQDEQLVKERCEKLGLKCHVKKAPLDPSQSALQEKARKLRYHWLHKLLHDRKLKYILTAHQLDDQLETVFHHFIRGSGIKGLSGMSYKTGKIIRPLLSFSRSAIENYQKKNSVPYREDESNKQSKYTRNFLRNEVLPLLRSHFDKLEAGLQTSLQNLQGEHALMNHFLRNWIDKNLQVKNEYFHIPLNAFSNRKGLSSLFFHLTDGELNTDEVRQLINSDHSGTFIHKNNFSILKDRKDVIIRPFRKQPLMIEINKAGIYNTAAGKFSIEAVQDVAYDQNPFSEYISTTKEIFPLHLRNWKEGDHFSPIGMRGHTKKLSDLFIDEKLHQFEKEDIPILVHDDKIVWVVGLRLSEHFKFRAMDKYIYKITFSRRSKDFRSQFFKHLF